MHEAHFNRFNPPTHERDQMQAEAIEALRGADQFLLFVFSPHECETPWCVLGTEATLFGNCHTMSMMQAHSALQEQINVTHAMSLLSSLPQEAREQLAALIVAGNPEGEDEE